MSEDRITGAARAIAEELGRDYDSLPSTTFRTTTFSQDDFRRAALAASKASTGRLADENIRLAAELITTRKALEPFANAANFYEVESQTDEDAQLLVRRGNGFASALTVRDFRIAQRAMRRQGDAAPKAQGGDGAP